MVSCTLYFRYHPLERIVLSMSRSTVEFCMFVFSIRSDCHRTTRALNRKNRSWYDWLTYKPWNTNHQISMISGNSVCRMFTCWHSVKVNKRDRLIISPLPSFKKKTLISDSTATHSGLLATDLSRLRADNMLTLNFLFSLGASIETQTMYHECGMVYIHKLIVMDVYPAMKMFSK